MIGITTLALPFLLFFGSFAAAPLAGPPLPLDPALAAIAPPQCLAYTSTTGVTKPDPNSTNQTELLFAEPEVQYFSTQMQKQLLGAIRHGAGSSSEPRLLASELPKLIKALITRPLAAYVEEVQTTDDELIVKAGLVFNAGDQQAAIKTAINKLTELAIEGEAIIGTENRDDGETWNVLRVSMQTPELRWGWHGDYFIFAVGEGTAETIIERMQGSAPDWLTQIRSEHPVERESSLFYLNIAGVLESLQPLLEKNGGDQIVEKLGLHSIEAFHSLAGFDALGCVTQSHLVTDGRRDGLLALLPYKPLSKRDLRTIPHDAMLAAAKRVDLTEVWDTVFRLVEDFDPDTVKKMEDGLRQIETQLGVHIKDDIIRSLDDTSIAYLPAGDLMTSWLGAAAAIKVKDADRLRTALEKLVAVAQDNQPQDANRSVTIRQSEFQGHTIHTLNVTGVPIPVAPSWCVTDEWLVFGLVPQTIRAVITRADDSDNSEKSLADLPAVRDLLSTNTPPSVVAYCDTPRLVRSLYPLVQMGAQMLSAQLQREGIELDASSLPSPDAIIKHLRPGITTMSHRPDGFYFHTQHSLPGAGSGMLMAPLAVGVLVGNAPYQAARGAARESQELNNMKQLALAVHNYHDANGQLPNNLYDDKGKALLSWRVRLLPYFENSQNLYDQFHLDEPWDSAHNLPLVQQMPDVFTSPTATLPPGKTPYVALVGKETLFPGNEKIRFQDITDGLSNTILFVHTTDAVTWTQPKDLDFDPTKPFQGLRHRNGRFLAARADGSCHRMSQALDEETMRAYATRAGGEVIK